VARRIPIRNLYDLLCYAWDVLEERDDTLVSELEGLSHVELLAKVLSVSVQRLWKRGLDRGYGTIGDDVRSPRGRLDVPRMVARQLEPLGLAACSFDALGHDVLHNQILATTARRLARLPQLHRELRDAMIAIGRTLADVSTIPVRSSTFSQVQLHGRLCRYRLPLHVCQLIHDQLVVDEVTGEVRFRDYVEDERRMAVLFEEFVCNFYRRELHGWKIRGSEKIAWDLVPLTPDAGRYVPEMRTDIVLRGAGRTVLIDTKFYAEAFVSRFENDKLRSAHLYQITTYLRSLAAATAGADASAAGVLLYPEVRPLPTLQFQHGPHRLTATGVDLTQGWREIHQRLLDIVASA
jgi:5-methylcytosine-specific restriction enzyme subunit McrC